jgi:hypothetical protein
LLQTIGAGRVSGDHPLVYMKGKRSRRASKPAIAEATTVWR